MLAFGGRNRLAQSKATISEMIIELVRLTARSKLLFALPVETELPEDMR